MDMSGAGGKSKTGGDVRLAEMLAPVRGRLSAASALSVFAALLWIPQAACVADLLAALITGEPGVFGAWGASAVFLALGIARAGLASLAGSMSFAVSEEAISRERKKLLAAQSRRSPIVAGRFSSAEIASLAADKLDIVAPYLTRYAPAMARTKAVPLVILAVAFALSWVVAVILLVAGPLIPVFMALVGMAARDASERQMQEIGGMNALLIERIRALTDLRLLDATRRTIADFEAAADRLRGQTMEVLRIAFLSSAVLELFAAIGVALVAVYVGFHLLGQLDFGAWGGKLTLGEGLFILLLAPAFFEPLRDLSSVWHDRAAGQAALDAIAKVTADGPEIAGGLDDARPAPAEAAAPAVRIEDLRFRHNGAAAPVFDGLALDIAAGEHVALMAPTGYGKSTLLALIAGLAVPDAGTVRIGGTALDGATAGALRARMAWIGQAPHLFSGTLSGNVALGRPGIGTAETAKALRTARLDHLADRRGSAALGEEGAGISGGEALRLAVARAVANARAGLILADEPTAHLDRETADEISDMLVRVAAGRTLIVATHDPVLAARMDRTVLLPDIAEGREGRT